MDSLRNRILLPVCKAVIVIEECFQNHLEAFCVHGNMIRIDPEYVLQITEGDGVEISGSFERLYDFRCFLYHKWKGIFK